MNETIRSILERRSNRGFQPKALTDEQMELLKQCAVASPTALNTQEWHFSFVTDKALLDEIEQITCEALGDRDADSAKRVESRGRTIFYGAPLVVFISCTGDFRWSAIDAGISAENLAIAAQSMGLGSVIIGLAAAAFEGAKKDYLAQKLCFPKGNEFYISVAIGVPAVTKNAHEVLDGRITEIK